MEITVRQTRVGAQPRAMYPRANGEFWELPQTIDAVINDGEYLVQLRIVIPVEGPPDEGFDHSEAAGSPLIESVTISRKGDGPWVAPGMVRGIRLHEAAQVAIARVAMVWTPDTSSGQTRLVPRDDLRVDPPIDEVDEVMYTRRGGPLTPSPEKVAAAYREVEAEGRYSNVLNEVAARVGVSVATVARRVKLARQLGLLETPRAGR